MHFSQNTKIKLILWALAIINLLTIHWFGVSNYSSVALIVLLFVLSCLFNCFLPRWLRYFVASVYLLYFCFGYVFSSIISNEKEVVDYDMYYDTLASCKQSQCIENLILGFEKEISSYYQEFSKNPQWQYDFIDWKQKVNQLCSKQNTSYDQLVCKYSNTYQEYALLVQIKSSFNP